MLIFSNQEALETEIGPKAKHLQELVKAGFNVPEFVIIPNRVVKLLANNDQVVEKINTLKFLEKEIIKTLKTPSYAVRSAAMVEDGKNESFAGQFKTILGITGDNLVGAITSVINNASEKLGKDLNFSVIIQKYVDPDQAGVIFSRDPMGGMEMVVEYNQGVGETVVGGRSVSRAKFLFSDKKTQKGFVSELAQIASEIEIKYSWPQDIEWAEKDGVIYVLQTRAITNISSGQWEGLQYLENLLVKDFTRIEYLFQQTSVTETFNRPKPLAFSILERLYAANGPIEKVYQKLGVVYQPTKQLRLFGNELFVDRQAEVRSILPALGYLAYRSNEPRLEKYSQLIITMWNWFCLSILSTKPDKKIQADIDHLLSTNFIEKSSLKERWLFVLKQYEIVFETNIRARKALESLERVLGSEAHVASRLLKAVDPDPVNITGEMLGNSFNLDDNSSFVMMDSKNIHTDKDSGVKELLEKYPKWKQKAVVEYIKRAQYYNLLRERARWLSVKLASYLRSSVVSYASKKFVDNPDLVYFATIEELLNGSESMAECLSLKKKHQSLKSLIMPKNISSFVVEAVSKGDLGVSSGMARGILVTKETLGEVEGEKILYTEVMSPDLVEYFDQVVGIVSKEGGLLSHLSIVARESFLPVVVSDHPHNLNHAVEINGSTGEIKYL